MRLRCFLLLLSGAGLAACQANVVLDDSDETDTTEKPTEPIEPVDPPGPPDPPAPAVFCESTQFSGEEDDAVVVLSSAERVEIVLRDGSIRTLDLPQAEEPSDDVTFSNYVAVGGDRIVITHVENVWVKDELTQSVRVRWFTRAGEFLEEELADHQYTATAVSNSNVTLLVESEPDTFTSRIVLRDADGSKLEVHDFDVNSPVLEGRYVAGYDQIAMTYGFLDLETGERWLNGAGDATSLLTESGFAYLLPGDDTPIFVVETPTSISETALDAQLPESIWIGGVSESAALLVSYGEPQPDAWHVDLASGSVTKIPNEGPNGEALLGHDCGLSPAELRADGAVLRAFRSGGDAFVAALMPGAEAFDRLGPTFGSPFEFTLSERAGTTLISVSDQQETFCPITDWVGAPSVDAVEGRALALVRGDITHVIEGSVYWDWQTSLTSEGTCMLAYDYAGTTRVIDVISGQETELGSATAVFFE